MAKKASLQAPLSEKQAVNQFVKKLESLDRSRSTREKFRDLLELGYCAYAKLTAPTEERAEELEARYMRIVNGYQDKDTIRAYPDLLNIAIEQVEDCAYDFFGEVSGQIGALNAEMGQFFTPFAVSKMMADIQLNDVEQWIEKRGYFTLSELACGSGGMVLAAGRVLWEKGINATTTMLVQAVDLSETAYYMTYLQLSWAGITAHVIRGNSLSLETFESAWTIGCYPFHVQHGHLSFSYKAHEDAPENQPDGNSEVVTEKPTESEFTPPVADEPKPFQMSLF